MRTITFYSALVFLLFISQSMVGQENYQKKIEALKIEKKRIVEQEKDALKFEVKEINERLDEGDLSEAEAKLLKEEAAKRRALNIENRTAIVDNQIALLERNQGELLSLSELDSLDKEFRNIDIFIDGEHAFGINSNDWWDREFKYDRRTYSDIILTFGLNNALIDGQSLDDSPYKIGGSKFFEIGWQWRTRVFDNSNWLRFNYGFMFQFNGLKPTGNQYFVMDGNQVVLEDFEYDLSKAKLRMDNLVFPIHFEMGASKVKKTEHTIRYSTRNRFKVGLGGYGGFNLGTRQKLKYTREGDRVKDKLKRDYNTNNLIYGLSGYMGFGDMQLYLKYDLNPIFKDAEVEQNNISLGLRLSI
ncbi:hypothetical protein [Allomuricauda sp. NBRC 101325]|uniref:hypothetical protein n=1 Tax=Allomuricauda sp. NBRC 101325 TaxID=1113758 RepID=UPI002552B521|nr:hypothetical protein [Muricauda sp. NBRC 101325]